MSKTPSALKWLAEKRARLAHDALHAERMVQELTERHQKLRTQLAALDETIRVYDAAIDPTAIAPVDGQDRYGKRGALRQTLIAILGEFGPDWVASATIELALVAKYNLSFASPALRKRWRQGSFCTALRRLARDGTTERLHNPAEPSGKHGYWRLKQAKTQSLADL
jgi:hypothetical protein